MRLKNCHFDASGIPAGVNLVMALPGDRAACGYCGEVVYDRIPVLAEHDFRWDGSRVIWFSCPFDARVHACAAYAETEGSIHSENPTTVHDGFTVVQ